MFVTNVYDTQVNLEDQDKNLKNNQVKKFKL